MTAATSRSKKSYFFTRMRSDLISEKRFLTVYNVFQIIGLPLASLMIVIMSDKNVKNDDTFGAIAFISVFLFALAILMGALIARNFFKHLYTKSLVDMTGALPLTHKQRFFADYISGMAAYLVPAALAMVASILILTIGSSFITPYDHDNFRYHLQEYLPLFIYEAVIVLIGMLLYYTMTVFAVVCTGSRFESVFASFAIFLFIPATIACIYILIVSSGSIGLDMDSVLFSPLFTATSPVGMTEFAVYFAAEYDTKGSAYSRLFINWLIVAVIVIALFIAGAYLLDKHRKAEDVSKPYVYKSFYYFFTTSFSFCILSLFFESNDVPIAGIFICGILYFITEIISNRGFRRIWMSVIRYAATVAAIFAIVSLCKETHGFGAAYRVPPASSISSVELNLDDIYFGIYDIRFTDKDMIKETVKLHETIVDRLKKGEEKPNAAIIQQANDNADFFKGVSNNIHITYHKKDGRSVARYYPTNSNELAPLLKKIYLSDEYAKRIGNDLFSDILYSRSDEKKELYSLDAYSDLNINIGTIKLTKNEASELCKLYKKEWEALTEEELCSNKLEGFIYSDYAIFESFTNTKRFLKEHGVTIEKSIPSEIEEPVMFLVANRVYSSYYRYSTYNSGGLFNEYHHERYKFVSDHITSDPLFDAHNNSQAIEVNLSTYDKEALELLDYAVSIGKQFVFDEEVSGMININGRTVYLPKSAENDELTSKLEVLFGIDISLEGATADYYYY